MFISSECLVSPQSAYITMPSSFNSEKTIAIAISLLKHKSPQTTQALKDLLTFIPNPNHAKEVLTTAVIRLIYTCPRSASWLFYHPDVLAPEINVKAIIVQELTRKVLSWGYTLEEFHFTADYYLEATEETKQSLLSSQPLPADESVFSLIRVLLMCH